MNSKKKKVIYSAIILTEESKEKLLNKFWDKIPGNWEAFAHHMTIGFKKPLPKEIEHLEGENVHIKGVALGKNNMVMALKVDGYYANCSYNKIPHITLAVNTDKGGTPVMSNDIEHWEELNETIDLEGTIEEVTNF